MLIFIVTCQITTSLKITILKWYLLTITNMVQTLKQELKDNYFMITKNVEDLNHSIFVSWILTYSKLPIWKQAPINLISYWMKSNHRVSSPQKCAIGNFKERIENFYWIKSIFISPADASKLNRCTASPASVDITFMVATWEILLWFFRMEHGVYSWSRLPGDLVVSPSSEI